MSIFGNLTDDGLEETEDRLGGRSILESDIYSGTVKLAYAIKSQNGAQGVNLTLQFGSKEHNEAIYITDRNGKNYFLNKDDNTSKVALPGYTLINDLCLITTGSPINEQESEEKIVNIYDYKEKKELPKSVQVLTELLGKEVSAAILKNIENKRENQNGGYVDIADTREFNSIDKFFDTDSHKTVPEARRGVEEATFWDSWTERNKGQLRDKRTIKDGAGKSGKPGGPPTSGGASSSKGKSLFGNKK